MIKFIENKIQMMILLALLVLQSCVGTVEEGKRRQENFKDPETSSFNFIGLNSATPISHDKIEVTFFPQFGQITGYNYYLFVNENTPILLNLEDLEPGLGGNLKYTVKNLTIGQIYKLKMIVRNETLGLESSGALEYFVSTFDNQTAQFLGINDVVKVIGQTDRTVKVSWVPATMNGIIVATSYDPVYYEVKYISEDGGPNNLNNPSYAGVDKIVTRVPTPPTKASPSFNPYETTITNLIPGKRYYFQVRAINQLWNYFDEDPLIPEPPVNREVNTRFMSVTMDNGFSPLDFNKDGITLANGPGVSAFDKVNIFWEPGSGTFENYQIYLREYDGIDDPEIDDLLIPAEMDAMKLASDFTIVSSSDSAYSYGGLSAYKWYQVKIVLCKTLACPLDTGNSDFGVISNMFAIRTQPQLAPFSGISYLGDPQSAATLDEISIAFDAVDTSIGFADELELYCIDPNDYANFVKFPTVPGTPVSQNVPISASGIGNCDGLKLEVGITPINLNGPLINISGVNTLNQTDFASSRYCFALAPAINFKPEIVKLDPSKWVIRCVNPEIRVPTMTEFTGVKGSCLVNQNTATVTWELPSGGVYNKFEAFTKDSTVSAGFSFNAGINDDVGYQRSGLIDSSILTHTFSNLRPGRKYYLGVLAVAYDPSGPITIHSEANLNVVECHIPLPKATFNEWTRVLSIGPKVDGRFPSDTHPYEIRDEAFLYEAINDDGIPYEVEYDTVLSSLENGYYQLPPGNYNAVFPYATPAPTDFLEPFDGVYNEDNFAASKYGIISLAWKDMNIEFLDSEFKSEQQLQVRSNRKYGYKVFRSDDNRASWKDLTTSIGLIQSYPYTYYLRPGSAEETAPNLEPGETPEMSRSEVTENMAFFTDYSIKAFNNDGDGVSRARVFWYKIVPVFEDTILPYDDNDVFPHHILKVVLPPPNMALVHRMMANRNLCQELGKTIIKDNGKNYICDYNGVGARAGSFPWTMGETVVDLGGDLMVDRYELGCNITRGDPVPDPTTGASMFDNDTATFDTNDYIRPNSIFTGRSTTDDGSSDTGVFRGCTGGTIFDRYHDYNDPVPPASYEPSYKRAIYGDCLGYNSISIRSSDIGAGCTWGVSFTSAFPGATILYPLPGPATNYSCDDNTGGLGYFFLNRPQVAFSSVGFPGEGLLDINFRRNIVTQGEFLAVHYNKGGAGTGGDMPWASPLGQGLYQNKNGNSSSGTAHRCSVNLASIGVGDMWRSRWIPTSHLDAIKVDNTPTYASIISSTIDEISTMPSLYDTGAYQAPNQIGGGADLRGMSPRYNGDMKISRLVASNNSKLPPLTGVDLADAQEYCNNFEVQLGVGDDLGNFTPMEAVKKKRLMRRQEFVAMSAWPETYNAADLTFVENECNISGKLPGNSSAPNGIDDVWSTTLPKGNASAVAVTTSLITGSSDNDNHNGGDPYHTGYCTSRFGIQDLVGNVQELNTDILFCDYSKDKFYWGQHSGNPYLGTGAGDVNRSVVYATADWRHVLNTAIIEYEDPAHPNFPSISGNKLWTRIDPTSGYCSLVDIDPLRVDNFFADQGKFVYASGSFKELLNPDNTVNSTLVENINGIDNVAADYLRNGDGFFLHFGPNNLAPQMKYNNSISLSGTNDPGVALGPYFNPLVGMALSCDQLTCSVGTTDNKEITTDFFSLNRAPDPAALKIDNFPIGGSTISTVGISEYNYTNNSLNYTATFDATTGANGFNGHHVVEKFIVKTNGTIQQVIKTFNDYQALQPIVITLSGVQWNVSRGATYKFKSGGHYASSTAGRYSAYIDPSSSNQNRVTDGFRCVVRVND